MVAVTRLLLQRMLRLCAKNGDKVAPNAHVSAFLAAYAIKLIPWTVFEPRGCGPGEVKQDGGVESRLHGAATELLARFERVRERLMGTAGWVLAQAEMRDESQRMAEQLKEFVKVLLEWRSSGREKARAEVNRLITMCDQVHKPTSSQFSLSPPLPSLSSVLSSLSPLFLQPLILSSSPCFLHTPPPLHLVLFLLPSRSRRKRGMRSLGCESPVS